jgi:nicotinate-nucleotide--dimethylbenzimidazole phosphoribosyltransferase
VDAPSASPFDDVRDLIGSMPEADGSARDAAMRRIEAGRGGLGRLGSVVGWAAAWQGRARPGAERGLVCLFASSHGVTSRGREADAAAELRARLDAFSAGEAPVGAVCAGAGLGFRAFDLALDVPTGDITGEPAMSEKDCVATMAFGMEAVAGGADLVALGVVGADAAVPASAIVTALTGDPPGRWAAPGREADLVTAALLRHGRPSAGDPLAILASLGGRDLAALAGAILAARHAKAPVVLDGFAAAAAAFVLHAIAPGAVDHCLAGHVSAHPGHAALLGRLGLEPLLAGLDLPEGGGLGGALALGLVKSAITAERTLPKPQSSP